MDGDGEPEGEADGDPECDGDGDGDFDGVGDLDGVGERDGVGESDGDGSVRSVGKADGTCEGCTCAGDGLVVRDGPADAAAGAVPVRAGAAGLLEEVLTLG